MRFIIILLLGLTVSATATIPKEGRIVRTVQLIVQNAIGQAYNDLQNLLNLIKGLTTNAESNVQSIIASGKNDISARFTFLESGIIKLISQGGFLGTCAQKNLSELIALKNFFDGRINSCGSLNLNGTIVNLQQGVAGEVSTLTLAIRELMTIVEECSRSVFDVVLCAVMKVNTIERLFQQITSNVSAAVENASSEASSTVAQIENCVQQTIGDSTYIFNKLTAAIKRCV